MIIACELCKTSYKVDEKLAAEPGFKGRCSKCKHLLTIHESPKADTSSLLTTDQRPFRNRIISLSNQKGGVAKTSSCLNLGVSLSLLKKRVLLVDFDVQANLTILLGYKKTRSFYDIIRAGTDDMGGVIEKTRYPNLWLLPSNSKMALLPKKYMDKNNFQYLLRDKLKIIEKNFDYLLIDTPPSTDFFTLNALIASNFVIIPCQCEYLSMHGVSHVEGVVNIIRKKINSDLDFKVLVTMYDAKDTSSKVLYSKIRATYKDKVFDSVIELDSKMQESQIMNVPVIHYDKMSRSALQYIKIARELVGE